MFIMAFLSYKGSAKTKHPVGELDTASSPLSAEGKQIFRKMVSWQGVISLCPEVEWEIFP